MKTNFEDYDIKVKEYGKPVFKAKGNKAKVKKETDKFFKDKF